MTPQSYNMSTSSQYISSSQPQSSVSNYNIQNNSQALPTPRSSSATPGHIIKSESQGSSTPSQSARPALAPKSNNQMAQPKPKSAKKAVPKHTPLPSGQYLGYHEFEKMYCPHHANHNSKDEKAFRKIRREWLAQLGIDEMPYQLIRVEKLQRDAVERRWAIEPQEKRQDIERKAIFLKRQIHISSDDITLRGSAPTPARPPTFDFCPTREIILQYPRAAFHRFQRR